MKQSTKIICLTTASMISVLLSITDASAFIKCVDSKTGKTTYTDGICPGSSKQEYSNKSSIKKEIYYDLSSKPVNERFKEDLKKITPSPSAYSLEPNTDDFNQIWPTPEPNLGVTETPESVTEQEEEPKETEQKKIVEKKELVPVEIPKKVEKKKAKKTFKPNYKTSFHHILKLYENLLGQRRVNDMTSVFNQMIAMADKRINTFSPLNYKEAKNRLSHLHNIALANTSKFAGTRFGAGDCKTSYLIYGLAKSLRLPIYIVEAPEHVYTRYILNKRQHINWEYLASRIYGDAEYIRAFGAKDMALSCYGTTFTDNESLGQLYYTIARDYKDAGKINYALSFSKKVLSRLKNFPHAWNQAGVLQAKKNGRKTALPYYKNAVELNPYNDIYRKNYNKALKAK